MTYRSTNMDKLNELRDKVAALKNQLNQISNKEIKMEKVWSVRRNRDIIYSSPIVAKLSNGGLVIVYQSHDWHAYVIDFITGETIHDFEFSHELYGRPLAEDINGDGQTEFIFADHAGEIRCYSEGGQLLWNQYSEFKRQGSGNISRYVRDGMYSYIQDDTKNWCDGLGIRDEDNRELNINVTITGGTGAGQNFFIRHVEWNQMFLYGELETPLDETSEYQIHTYSDSDHMFQHAGTLSKENDHWYLYITGFDMCCRKIDAETGEILWVTSTREAIEPYPLIADLDNDGKLECYVASVDWEVYCLDCETGEKKWSYAADSGNDSFLKHTTLSDGSNVLIFSSRDGRVYLLNPDGTLRERTTNSQADIDCSPVVDDFNGDGKKELIYGGDKGFVYCCDEDCNTLWRTHIGSYINSSPVAADINYNGEKEVLISDMSGSISILNSYDGKVLDTIYCHGSVEGTPAIGDFDGDGEIELVVTTLDGFIELYRFKK